MKVLQLVPAFDIRYLMNDAVQISLALADEGHDVTVITSNYGENYDRYVTPNLSFTNIRIINKRSILLKSPWSEVRAPLYLLPNLNYSEFNILHVYNAFNCAHLQSILISKLSKAKIVLRTEIESPDVLRSLKRPFLHSLFVNSAKQIDAFTTFTERGKKNMELLGIPNEKVYVVPPLLNRNPFLKISMTKPARFTVGMIGSISFVKGWDQIVDVLLRYFKQHKQDRLLLAGTIEDRTYADALLSKLNQLSNFRYLGPIFPSWRFFPMVNALVFPSRKEGAPKAVLESMSSGRVSICSNIPAFNEWIKHGENGLIAKSADEFFSCIEVAKRDYERISANAVKASEFFDAKKIIKVIEEIYYSL